MKHVNTFLITVCAFAIIGMHPVVFADWNQGDPAKWIQLPDLVPTGLDICVDNINRPGGSQRRIGDDFECASTDKITGVHLWVSWKGDPDPHPQILGITLGIWSDNPMGSNGHSEPLEQLWTYQATPDNFTERLYFTLPEEGEGWWDPAYAGWLPDADNEIWQINIDIDPSVAFEQEGNELEPVTYWLTVEIQLPEDTEYAIGWKTRDRWDGQYKDAAVWHTPSTIPWHALLYPAGHEYEPDKIDMAFVLTSGEPEELDFGDAPDNAAAMGYPTLLINDGARHIIGGPWLGDATDAPDSEPDGQPNAAATGDDNDGNDDEDGVQIPVLVQGQLTSLSFQVSNSGATGAVVTGWIDYNGDKIFGDSSTGELIVGATYTDGTYTPNFIPPVGSVVGNTYARFRISNDFASTNPYGLAQDGEVEDYLVTIEEPPDELDFGDAPETQPDGTATGFPTKLASNGARHIIVPGVLMGNLIDAEADGQPTLPADGDDLANQPDEDGVVFTSPLIAGQPATVDVMVSVPGFLNVWIDFYGNYDWNNPGEQIFTDQAVAAGLNNLTFTVPAAAAAGPSYVRFRYTTYQNAGQGYVGQARDGEVEDYLVTIEEEPTDEEVKFQQLPLNGARIGDLQYYGHDELSTAYMMFDMSGDVPQPIGLDGCYMADDFADYKHSPVIRIKWWGSYIENYDEIPVPQFLIAFETDVPANPDNPDSYSHPGELLYSEIVTRVPAGTAPQAGEFTEVNISSGGLPCNEGLYEYETQLENPFPQDPNTVYWIKIVALYDMGPEIQMLMDILNMQQPPMTLCEFLNLTWAEQMQIFDQFTLPRWGWHNRDYTIRDFYASTAVPIPPHGEHAAGNLPDGTQVWHFQDDAVSGPVMINPFIIWNEEYPESPFVEQLNWQNENYVFALPYCPGETGVDGPPEIENYSKDLAFELWTKPVCLGDMNDSGNITTLDLSDLTDLLVAERVWVDDPILGGYWSYDIPSTDPAYVPAGDINESGNITTLDLSDLVDMLVAGRVWIDDPILGGYWSYDISCP